MFIRRLRLVGFRNYDQAELSPARGVTVLMGQNAQGKTNLIEAIHLCCLGRSHRTARDGELVRWGTPGAQVSVTVDRRDGPHDVSVQIGADEKRKKSIKVNGAQVARVGELMGHVNAVLFSPEDLRLVKDGPEGRRRFLDMEISQAQPAYFYALQRYMRALAQRNALLRRLSEGGGDAALLATLDEWDALLVEAGAQVIERRIAYLAKLSPAASEAHAALSGGKEKLTLSYEGRAADGDELYRLLRACRTEDLRRGTTGTGPHRDDYRIVVNGRDARAFASQGQQRTAALSLKLAEIEVLGEMIGESPVLLLDDVMSELDVNRRQMLLSRIEKVQTLITCTHESDLGGACYETAYRVEGGTLSKA